MNPRTMSTLFGSLITTLALLAFLPNTVAAACDVVVAPSGGNFTSISAAVAALNPTATDPCLIRVMPGTYAENVKMKSYVRLQAAAAPHGSVIVKGGVTIQGGPGDSLADVIISGFVMDGITVEWARKISITQNILPGGISMRFVGGALVTGNTLGSIYHYWPQNCPGIGPNVFTGNEIGDIKSINDGPFIGNCGPTLSGNHIRTLYLQYSGPTVSGNIIEEDVTLFGISNCDETINPKFTGNYIGNDHSGSKIIVLNCWAFSVSLTGNVLAGCVGPSKSSCDWGPGNVTPNGTPLP